MLYDLLFDGLWSPAIAWVVVQFALIANWSWRRTRTSARTVWCGFASLPLLLALSALVVTDHERIVLLCEELADAVENRDVGAIARRLDATFSVAGRDRAEFVEELEGVIARYKVWDAKLRRFEIAFPAVDRAEAFFSSTARVRSEDLVYEWFAARWRLELIRRENAWKVTNIERARGTANAALRLDDFIR